MPRIALTLMIALAASAAAAQGLASVTRPTPALEHQAKARGFFDAAGINITGGQTAITVTRPTAQPYVLQNRPRPLSAAQARALASRPVTPAPQSSVQARPYVRLEPPVIRTNILTARTPTRTN